MADIKAIIIEAANRYGLDPDTALRIAQIESSLNPSAQNPKSSAGGLFQFIDSTWAKYGNGKSKYDPYANADAGMRFMRDNISYLKPKLGRDLTPGEIYLAHQQGMGGAAQILSNPSANAIQLLGRQKVLLNGGNESMTAADFAGLWAKKMGDTQIPAQALVQGMTPPASMAASNNSEFNVAQPGRISYTDIAAAQAESRREEIAREQAMEDNEPGFLEGAGLAIKNNWSILAPFRAIGGYDPDPNFRLTRENLTRFGQGIPDQYLDEFEDAVSDQHAEAIRNRLLNQMEENAKIASMGVTGMVLQMGAAMTDPGALAATAAIGAATGGIGLPAAIAARFGRVGLVGLGAAEGIAGNLATDVPLIAVNPTSRWDDLKYSIGTGLLMGGAFGAMRKNPNLADEAANMARLGKQMQDENVDRYVRAVDGNGSTGAAQVLPPNTIRTDTDELIRTYKALDKQHEAVFGRVRFDVVGSLLQSKNPMSKRLARLLGEDAVRAKDGVTPIAATERQSRLFRVATNNWMTAYDGAWREFRKANKVGFWQSADAMQDFKRQVTDYIRETNPSAKQQFPAHVQKAGSAFEKEMKNWWQMAKAEGLVRTEFGVENYFPRYADLRAASQRIAKYGYSRDTRNGGLASLFREAILEKQPNIDRDLAHKLGYAIVDRFHKLQAGEHLLDRNTSSIDLDDLEDVLGNYLSPDEIANVKAFVTRDAPKDTLGGSSRLKHRIDLNENFSAKVKNRETGALDEVSVKDFYINDPNLAFHMYSRQMSGQLAMAKVKVYDDDGRVILNGIRDASDWETLKRQVMAVGNEFAADTKADLQRLDFLYSAITGTPMKGVDESGDFATALRMLRDFNFTRLMGQVGFSQLPEFGRMTAQVGVKTMWNAMPEFRQIIQMARTGRMTEEFAEELDAMGAFGTELVRGSHHIEADEFGTPISMGANTMIQRLNAKVSPVQHKMNHFVAKYSGMGPINALFQRWAARAMAVKFVRMATVGDKINVKRMKALGLDDKTLNAIFENIRTHATYKGGVVKPSKLEALKITKWDGPTAAAFQEAIYRASRNMILENDAGQFARWMAHPLGKTFLQFRSFAISSWTKALLQGANLRDAEAGLGFLASSFLGALVYAGQTRINLIGDPEADKKAQERLSWGNLAAAGFQRSSESSLLPIPVDMLSQLVTGEPIFDMRSSGLQTTVDNAFGNPTMDLVSTTFKAGMGLTTAALGDDYSAPDYRNLTRILPFQRMMGFVQFFNWLGSDLPRRELRD